MFTIPPTPEPNPHPHIYLPPTGFRIIEPCHEWLSATALARAQLDLASRLEKPRILGRTRPNLRES